MIQVLILLALLGSEAASSSAEAPPRYLVYLHGQIVEGSDGRPAHPEFGTYDYPAIVTAFEEEGFEVISEVRPAGTDGQVYADRVAERITRLLASGVAPSHISVVGNSKGGGIAVAVCRQLANPELNFVFTGTCVSRIENWPVLQLRGRILSIWETSDEIAGSCAEAFAESDVGPVFEELRIETGKGHGAFYSPDPAWFEPAAAWCRGQAH
jgi:hypothetical protein